MRTRHRLSISPPPDILADSFMEPSCIRILIDTEYLGLVDSLHHNVV
jgi:hypothetical protein